MSYKEDLEEYKKYLILYKKFDILDTKIDNLKNKYLSEIKEYILSQTDNEFIKKNEYEKRFKFIINERIINIVIKVIKK